MCDPAHARHASLFVVRLHKILYKQEVWIPFDMGYSMLRFVLVLA